MPSQYYVILKFKKPVNKNKFKFLGRMNNLISFHIFININFSIHRLFTNFVICWCFQSSLPCKL